MKWQSKARWIIVTHSSPWFDDIISWRNDLMVRVKLSIWACYKVFGAMACPCLGWDRAQDRKIPECAKLHRRYEMSGSTKWKFTWLSYWNDSVSHCYCTSNFEVATFEVESWLVGYHDTKNCIEILRHQLSTQATTHHSLCHLFLVPTLFFSPRQYKIRR